MTRAKMQARQVPEARKRLRKFGGFMSRSLIVMPDEARHYFDLVETPVVEELEWLGPSRS